MINLSDKVKDYAKKQGADLVGIADINRWKSAPFNRTPMALMKDSTCAIVMGFHYLDSCVELGGQPDARMPGPSVSNHIGSEHGNYAAFRLCKFLESQGYDALMVPATAWWNYRANDASPRGFSADITHYYAACAAGLGEIAWNNLCITPQFGPRQRWVTVITNAPLDFDPMYDGEKLCDGCKLCEKHCPGDAFTKESNGTLTVDFGEKQYTFCHKNLWRCAMGENFQLDSFMKRPDVCNEETINELCEDWASGSPDKRFSWKMGQCLKWCVPRKRRYFDRTFTKSPRRRRDVEADYSVEGIKKAYDLICNVGKEIGVSKIITFSEKTLVKNGINLRSFMPTATSCVSVVECYPENCEGDTTRQCLRNSLWIAKRLEIDLGVDTMVESGINGETVIKMLGKPVSDTPYKVHTIITSVPFEDKTFDLEKEYRVGLDEIELTQYIKSIAKENGADLCGISTAERIDVAAGQLNKIYYDENYFVSVEQGWGEKANRPIDMKGKPKNPKAVDEIVKAKFTTDYIKTAKSVIVIGLSMLDGSVKNVMKPPAYKAVHYASTVHKEMFYQNRDIALEVCKALCANGYKAYITDDLIGLSSLTYAFGLPDIRANNFPAVCAGLGTIGKNGLVINETYGSKVRYVAIVTDADLISNDIVDVSDLKCKNCDVCIKSCPSKALCGGMAKVEIEGKTFTFEKCDRLRCDWAMRYGLMKEAGPKALGSQNDFPVPEKITPEILVDTIKESDRLQISNFAPIVEKCFTECPYNN